MIYTTGTIAINGNTVTGTGTDFSAPLSLIRVGCTLIAVSDPIQIFTITEIKSGTELSVTPAANPAIPAGTKFSILLSDSISVDGLAQDVAETLRYYQSKETEVAEALEWSQDHIADKIGLGAEHRNWPDCNDPTGYIGFCRAVESESRNFPSIASGEIYLVGWLARGDNAVINGCFVGTISLSLYTYRYNPADNTFVWAKQAKQGDSPTFEHVILDRTSDQESTSGGLVRSVLKGSDGAQRTGGQFYSEIRSDNKSYTTISNQRGDKVAYAAVTEDGDFVLSNGDFIGRTARLYSDVNRPLILESQFPTIRFLETDKPEGAPEFSFIVDSGNWRIEKDHYTDHPGSNCISYSHDENAIAVPKLKADYLLPPNNIDATKVNLRIPYTGMTNPVEFGAPAGAEPNKYYPVIFQFQGWIGTEILAEITVSTASKIGSEYPNNNSVHLWFRNRGWSDCGTVAFGHYRAWDSNELAINCVRTSAKNYQNYAAVYVMGSAFPVKLSATVGTEVIIPTSDFTPAPSSDAPTFKWGISNTNEGLGLDEVGIIGNTLNFSSGLSGFYCSDIFRTFDGIPYASTGYNNQKWTGLQDFTTTRINSSDFSRRLKFEAAETAKSNATLSLWGSDSRPSVLEYNLSNPDTEEGIGFGYYCQLNTDNSILFCVNGAVNCVTLSQSSDRELKDNIQVIGDATEAIRKMNGYTYTLKENGLPYAGVIAQEVMEALPEAVGSFTHYGKELQGPTVDGNELREETRYLNVDYAAVTGLLVQVARETDNRVTELEEENASLRANIAEMDERIAKLEELVSKLTGSEK